MGPTRNTRVLTARAPSTDDAAMNGACRPLRAHWHNSVAPEGIARLEEMRAHGLVTFHDPYPLGPFTPITLKAGGPSVSEIVTSMREEGDW